MKNSDHLCSDAYELIPVSNPDDEAHSMHPTCSGDLRHGEPILSAVSLKLFRQAVAQLRSQAMELLSLGRMIKRQGASLHGFICLLVSESDKSRPISSRVTSHGCAFGTAILRRIVPFLYPL